MYTVCFGDSICNGDGVTPDKAWVSLLTTRLAQRVPEVRVRNAGVNGETAEDGLHRLENVLSIPVPDLLYVQFGLNDAWYSTCFVEEYVAHMREIVFRALERGVRAVLAGTNHPVWVEQDMYGNANYPPRVRQFNAALRDAFAMPPDRFTLVDIEQWWDELGSLEEHVLLLQADGVHLSETGNRFYADRLLPAFLGALPE